MKHPIRVLQITGAMGSGGLETMIMNWYRNIDRTKVQFDFLVHHQEKCFYDDEIEKMGGRIFHMSLSNDHNLLKYKKDLKAFFEEHGQEYTVVHGHHSTYGVFYFKAAKKAGIPIRISHSHIASFTKSIQGYIFSFLSRLYKKYANIHFACSRAAGDYMYGNGSDYQIINNGIDTEMFHFSKEKRQEYRKKLNAEGKTLLVHVGRFHDQKNHTFLLDIFAEYKKINPCSLLVMIGIGPLQEQMKQKAARLNLSDSALFLDQKSNVYDYLSAADVFVFPSLYEGLPLTLVEAQCSGLPIVCSDTVTDETKLTDYYYALSLEQSPTEWANTIEKVTNLEIDRGMAACIVRKCDYDCKGVVNAITERYFAFENTHGRI